MLKGIDARLNTDVLAALHGMGHGDLLALVDTNFPAQALARSTVKGRLLRMENLTAAQAAQAILSVFPLDTFVDDFALRMQVVGEAHAIPAVQAEVQAEIDAAEGRARPLVGIDRFAFYDMARTAYAVVQTGERRFYGCVLLRKGVIAPDV